MASVHAVIMAGGSGTRFWPASRQVRPKQLLPLFGGKSLLELAFDRLEGAVAPEEAAIDAVVNRSIAEDGPDAVDVVCILDLQMKYLVAIGAVGSEASDEGAGGAASNAG